VPPPRRKAKPHPEGRSGKSTGRCERCGKVAHSSRSKAKRAMRNGHGHEFAAVTVYPCGQYFHVGHHRGAKR
jgi:uncharacterized C2H2 Zn-finger protein